MGTNWHFLQWRIFPLLALLFLVSCKTNTFLSSVDSERITVSNEEYPTEDAEILELISPYRQQLDVKMNRVIGHLETDLIKERPEGTLNNWMTDIIYERANSYLDKDVDFAIQNYGGIRIPKIGAGPITVRTIYELMPFDNEIVVVALDSALMHVMFDHMAEGKGWPVSGQIRMTIDVDNRAKNVLIDGKPLSNSKTYYMALPDYVANGGGGCDFLKPLAQIKTGIMVRDAIIEYLDTYKAPMSVVKEQRVVRMETVQ